MVMIIKRILSNFLPHVKITLDKFRAVAHRPPIKGGSQM